MSDPSQSEYRTIYSRVCSGCYHRNRARRNAGDHREQVCGDSPPCLILSLLYQRDSDAAIDLPYSLARNLTFR